MIKIEESAVGEISDRIVLIMAQFGLVLFVIWVIAAAFGKGHLARPADKPRLRLSAASASKWHAALDPSPAPYNEQAWKTAVGMAVSA